MRGHCIAELYYDVRSFHYITDLHNDVINDESCAPFSATNLSAALITSIASSVSSGVSEVPNCTLLHQADSEIVFIKYSSTNYLQ